jgi:copper chaperone CopZ
MPRVTYTIPNMHCPACVMHLEALEDELPGIHFIRANYKKQCMDVEFDDSQLTEDVLRQAIGELGYEIA